jgi:hypothetical protein
VSDAERDPGSIEVRWRDRWCDACGAGLPESPPVRVYEVRTAACEACPEVVVGAFCRACLGRLRDELTRALEQAA